MEAVERAINECIREDVLRDFLEDNSAEAIKVSIYEYNEEEHMRMKREDAFEDGRRLGLDEGRKLGHLENLIGLLTDLGEIPPEIAAHAEALDVDTLKAWTKLAARADSMEEFLEQIK